MYVKWVVCRNTYSKYSRKYSSFQQILKCTWDDVDVENSVQTVIIIIFLDD